MSLISHTNVGKTTLARTLLRRDVGEVLDQAHVTETSEVYTLIETHAARLQLWDTPGLGDSARLVRRLQGESNPLGWLLHQVWDRVRDRPLYCSQEAARNIKQHADIVLYLVSAAEEPQHAGYVPYEMELLTWLAKPVVVLLNQTGGQAGDESDSLASWRAALAAWPIVDDVLPLDAFTRCWVQEDTLLARLIALLPEPRRPAMRALTDAWRARNLAVFAESTDRIGEYLVRAAADSETLSGQGLGQTEKRRAMRLLATRLDDRTQQLMDALIELHGLTGRHRVAAQARLEEDFRLPGEAAWSSGSAAILGAAMGGAAGGLVADVVTGGLSLGGGALAGAILGAAGAAGLLKGFQVARGGDAPVVRWEHGFLVELCRETMLRYLAVAHFGRGRGEWRETQAAARLRSTVDRTLEHRAAELARRIEAARNKDRIDAESFPAFARSLLSHVLCTTYPQAVNIF